MLEYEYEFKRVYNKIKYYLFNYLIMKGDVTKLN